MSSSTTSSAVEITQAVAGSGFEIVKSKMSGFWKIVAGSGLAVGLVIWFVIKVAEPQQDLSIEKQKQEMTEAKLDREAKRINDKDLVKALVETSAANSKLSVAVEKFTSAYNEQVQLNKEHAEMSKRLLETNEKANRLLETIKDDQKRGAWRENDKPSENLSAKKK